MMLSPDFVTGVAAFIFTLMILSYLIGDNPLFRAAVYIFVGVSAGYVAAVAFHQVILTNLIFPLVYGAPEQKLLFLIPLVLSLLMFLKISPQLTKLGAPSMGVLVGVSAAVAIGGAITGTLIPQIGATINLYSLNTSTSPVAAVINAAFILAGVIFTLIYFQFSARAMPDGSMRRSGLIELGAFLGSIFVAITLGVLFAGVYSSALTALIERLHFFGTFFGLG
jgi:hypothetical protein